MQTRTESFIEAITNTSIGYTVAVVSQIVLFLLVGINDVPLEDHLLLGLYFTVISIVRGYLVRGWFNAR